MPPGLARNAPGTGPERCRNLSGTLLERFRKSPGTVPELAQSAAGAGLEHFRNLSGTLPERFRDWPGTLPELVWNFFRNLSGTSGAPPELARNVRGKLRKIRNAQAAHAPWQPAHGTATACPAPTVACAHTQLLAGPGDGRTALCSRPERGPQSGRHGPWARAANGSFPASHSSPQHGARLATSIN
jgi:hypothetical protein